MRGNCIKLVHLKYSHPNHAVVESVFPKKNIQSMFHGFIKFVLNPVMYKKKKIDSAIKGRP